MYLTLRSLEHFNTTQLPEERTVLLRKYFNHGGWGKKITEAKKFQRTYFKKQLEGQVFNHVTNTFLEIEFWLQ